MGQKGEKEEKNEKRDQKGGKIEGKKVHKWSQSERFFELFVITNLKLQLHLIFPPSLLKFQVFKL